jgi:hypothetical protein
MKREKRTAAQEINNLLTRKFRSNRPTPLRELPNHQANKGRVVGSSVHVSWEGFETAKRLRVDLKDPFVVVSNLDPYTAYMPAIIIAMNRHLNAPKVKS